MGLEKRPIQVSPFQRKCLKLLKKMRKEAQGSISILFESICEGDLGQIDRLSKGVGRTFKPNDFV